ncbi:lantibiotic dehydratase C-terminal domain-containing protein [Streptosporangium sp. NPDC023615]|uniref:lantibiotic dehydratase C-terminal domain-containing protein n=1 Tax=Streptosporangium sp. NPDC023615 TaxID=3154794 RepID=UPI00343BBE6C
MDETEWVSAHAFHQADLDRLIVRAVAPLVTELGAERLMERYFFLRYWDGGPHLRLRVLPRDAAARGRVPELIDDRFRAYFALAPAAAGQSPGEYARAARELALREGVTAYEPLPFPTNTVRYVPYRREHARYGHGADVEAVERHFDDSSRIVLDLLVRGLSRDQRAGTGLAMILVAWFAGGRPRGEPPSAGLSSSADVSPSAGAASSIGMPSSAGVPERVVDLARQMRLLTARASELPATWPLVGWARSVSRLARTLETRPDEVLDLCAHLACNRLGVPPPLEGRLRRLAARAAGTLDEAVTT